MITSKTPHLGITHGNKLILVLVNLHIDNPEGKPEFFILTQPEALEHFINTPKVGENRTYLDYKRLKKMNKYQNNWVVFNRRENTAMQE